MVRNHFVGAIATLVGTVIGAGILGIPYVVAKSGILIGIIHIIVIGLAVLLLSLYIGEVCLRTKGKHQLVGYAGLYLGKWGKRVMAISIYVGIYGALIAYLIGESQSLNALFGLNQNFAMLLFFVIMSYLIWRGLNIIEGAEIYLTSFLGLVVLLILMFSVMNLNLENLTTINLKHIFLPYGVVFAAMMGLAAIPELKEELLKDPKHLKRAIIIGMFIPIIIYILFSIAIVGTTGTGTTEIATIGLGDVVGQHMIILGNLFAILGMATGFLSFGLALHWTFQYDYKLKRHTSWALTCLIPLGVAMLDFTGFVQVLGISGAIAGGLAGLVIIFMHKKAKEKGDRKPEYNIKPHIVINTLLFIIFSLGIIYTLITFLA